MYFISCSIVLEGKIDFGSENVILIKYHISALDVENGFNSYEGKEINDISFIEDRANRLLDDYDFSIYRRSLVTDLNLKISIKMFYQETNWYRPCSYLSQELISRLANLNATYEYVVENADI